MRQRPLEDAASGEGRGARMPRSPRLLVALAVVAMALALAPLAVAQDEYCQPSDYERQSTRCTGPTRQVQYKRMRECKDPFPLQAAHEEVCNCSPEDYDVTYSFDEDKKCMMFYVPRPVGVPAASLEPSCNGSLQSAKVEVDEAYCELKQVPCTQDHVRVTYSECYYGNQPGEPDLAGGEPAFEVIYYFDSSCNPAAKGSIKLPPNTLMPCVTKCGAGKILDKAECLTCPAGTYSTGGAVRFQKFYTEPTKQDGVYSFQYYCMYTNATGTFSCESWHVEADTLAVGPFDEPNTWYQFERVLLKDGYERPSSTAVRKLQNVLQDECASDPAYDCHNNLQAFVKMTVKLKRNGYVKFKYMVSAEKGSDGLSFYIDVQEQPSMPLQSMQFEAKEVKFPLTEGYHTLTWVYSKDEKGTAGSDDASIFDLEVDGTDFNEHTCIPCPAGFHSGEGAPSCLPCDVNMFSGMKASSCEPCAQGTYSLNIPRDKCLPSKPCDPSVDAAVTFGPCNAQTKMRTKSYHWLKPHICAGKLPADVPEKCPPCPAGQVAVEQGSNVACEFCPPGSVRDGAVNPGEQPTNECTKCEPGFVAIKELNLAHMHLQPGEQLPPEFATGCSQGDCSATGGWRMAGGSLSTAHFDGDSVAMWLKMNITLEMVGEVSFNFSVDIPAGDDSRGFFFYIDDSPIDEMVDSGEGSTPVSADPMMSGPWQIEKGNHTLMWKWVKANATLEAQHDNAKIYDIKIRGVVNGGATTCERIPDGAQLVEGGDTWEECPAGYYSDGGTSQCAKCPANTFNAFPFGGKWACLQCGTGTTSAEGSTACQIGDVDVPTSFCKYLLPNDGSMNNTISYDLAPLSRLHPGRMFGPVYDDPSTSDGDNGPLYYISICDSAITNATCVDNAGRPLNSSACRVNPKSKLNTKFRPAHSLGDRIALVPLGSEPALQRRGFHMILTGERCFGNNVETNTTVTFICDPGAGYGTPHAWTEAGKEAALNPDKSYPEWIDRSASAFIPIEVPDRCAYEMVWYSAFACPMCTVDDYEEVEVSGCVNNTHITFKYKQPQICQPNPEEPLPPNVPCRPCTAEDYIEFRDACADERGIHNVTYQWIHPKLCDENLPGAATLPEDIVAGECVHTVFLESADLLKPQYLALLVLGAVAIVTLALVSLVTWLKSRKIYAMYSKLAIPQDDTYDGDFGDHDEEMEEVEGHASTESSRLKEDEDEDDTVVADPTEYRSGDEEDED